MRKSILIVGANFENKGAQSMLFITMDEVKKRNPEAAIYYAASDKEDLSNYKFEYVYTSEVSKSIALNRRVPIAICKAVIKDTIKTIIGKRNNTWKFFQLKKIMNSIDMIIDVSGFNLGRKWDLFTHEYYLDNIRLAKKYNIPIYLMPQSFGPFNYPDDKKFLLNEMAEMLPYASIIYAREREGYQMLKDNFHLNNLILSSDLVLQNKGVDFRNIYKKIPEMNIPIVGPNSVGIIPNKQCFAHGKKAIILETYKRIIEKIIMAGKDVYIFRHSTEDLSECREVFQLVTNNQVHLLENDFSCFEYDAFIKQFDFVICSRYHGNVHAYRNCIPSILLGWAVKYAELAELLGQKEYSFDVTDDKLNSDEVVKAVERMCNKYQIESKTIMTHLKLLQKENCFEKAFEE